MRKFNLVSILLIACVAGCAGPNPNPGERTTDLAWTSGNNDGAFHIVEPHAIAGKPWAQLRLAIFYENGMGVEKDLRKAESLYLKAIKQRADNDWSNGVMVGAMGESGFFNQNSDAIISEYNLAALYYYAYMEKNDSIEASLVKADFHITNVISDSNGKAVFFCCEFSGGRGFSQDMFTKLAKKIKDEMSKDNLK